MELSCLGPFSACVGLVSCGVGVLCAVVSAVGHSTILTADSRSTEKPWARLPRSLAHSHSLSRFLSSFSHTLSHSSVSPNPGLEPAHLHTFSGRSCRSAAVSVMSRPRGSAGGLLVTVWTGPEVAPRACGNRLL